MDWVAILMSMEAIEPSDVDDDGDDNDDVGGDDWWLVMLMIVLKMIAMMMITMMMMVIIGDDDSNVHDDDSVDHDYDDGGGSYYLTYTRVWRYVKCTDGLQRLIPSLDKVIYNRRWYVVSMKNMTSYVLHVMK